MKDFMEKGLPYILLLTLGVDPDAGIPNIHLAKQSLFLICVYHGYIVSHEDIKLCTHESKGSLTFP